MTARHAAALGAAADRHEVARALAVIRGWSVPQATVVVRLMLSNAGLPLTITGTPAEWHRLVVEHFAADVHARAFEMAVA